jgi:hypothetical protein
LEPADRLACRLGASRCPEPSRVAGNCSPLCTSGSMLGWEADGRRLVSCPKLLHVSHVSHPSLRRAAQVKCRTASKVEVILEAVRSESPCPVRLSMWMSPHFPCRHATFWHLLPHIKGLSVSDIAAIALQSSESPASAHEAVLLCHVVLMWRISCPCHS